MLNAHGIESYAWLLIAVPLFSSGVLLIGGNRLNKWGHWLGALVPVALFGYVLALFFAVKGESNRHVDLKMFTWIPVAGFHVDAGLLLDPLAITFALLITGVGGLIHIYAVGYLDHDPGRRRFFGYFNFFVAAMLLLVLADSYLVLYVGWECVGLASYLLISYYFNRNTAATAGNKAFYANRVGDVGLSIAIMLMFAYFGTTSFAGVFAHFGAGGNSTKGVAAAIGIMLLVGACSKSGQVPLQSWLPDAMEGPTPVSALIHAATMVTAGVYLIARSATIFEASQAARTLVVIVGAVTLLYGCVSAFGQDDLKKVLAYSTVSQIGYMFLAVGLGKGVFAIGIIHLLGHGFFKAALFLSAGAVMHAMNDRIDMRRFGGLWRVMPVTFGVFTAGTLAITGIPPFTGFWTKDKIIESAFDKGGTSGWVLGICALLGAGLTAAYMTRALVMTFLGQRRWEDDVHPHEAKPVMTVPMSVLGILSLVGGYLLVFGGGVQHWLTPSVGPVDRGGRAHRQPRRALGDHDRGRRAGHRRGLGGLRGPARSGAAPRAGLAGHGGSPQEPVRRRVQRGGADAARSVADPSTGLLRQPRRRRRGQRRRGGLRRGLRTVAEDPNRLRPKLCALDARRVHRRHRGPSGGEVPVTAHSVVLPILLAIPLVGSLVVFALKETQARLAKQLTLAVSLAVLVYTVVVGFRFDTGPSAARFQYLGSWTWIKAFGVHLAFGVDGIALVLVGLSVVLVPTVILASWNSFDSRSGAEEEPSPTSRHRSVKNFMGLILLARVLHDRRLHGDGRLPVLRLLRGDARADVLHHRQLRRATPAVRRGEVLPVLAGRRPADAGLGHRPVRDDRVADASPSPT